jgi:capsular polysaccharide biosynthesis protein
MTPVSWQAYGQAIERALPWILLISIGTAAVAYTITRQAGIAHEAHLSYTVVLAERSPSADYQFDGYYALQASELFTETLAEWAKTPEVVVRAYERANVPLPTRDGRQLSRLVTAEAVAPQLVRLTVRHGGHDEVVRLAQALRQELDQQVRLYHEQGVPAVTFTAVATEPWVGTSQPNIPLIVTATFVIVLVLSLNIVLLIASLRV